MQGEFSVGGVSCSEVAGDFPFEESAPHSAQAREAGEKRGDIVSVWYHSGGPAMMTQ